MTDIVMTSFNRCTFTEQAVIELALRTPVPYRLIVVDNGSTDGTREFLVGALAKGIVQIAILLDHNHGLERAKNIGLGLVESPVFVNMDDDIIVPKLEPDWLTQLLALLEKYPDYAALALRPHIQIGMDLSIYRPGQEVAEFKVCGASARAMRTDLVRQVGGWRSEYTNRSEEWHICNKLRALGYKVGFIQELRCIHLFGDGETTNPWGYPHWIQDDHREVWPPVYTFDYRRLGIDWETCRLQGG